MANQPVQISRDHANSASTTQSEKPPSVFSDYDLPDTSATASPATSLMDELGIVELSKEDFETNTKKRKRSFRAQMPKIIKGSTYGGADPLHALLRSSGIEPLHWREERQRQIVEGAKRSKSGKKPKASTPPARYLKPERYDRLPFSPQDYFSSGLDLNSDPETRESFWRRVKKGWEAGCKRESVEARRRRFAKL